MRHSNKLTFRLFSPTQSTHLNNTPWLLKMSAKYYKWQLVGWTRLLQSNSSSIEILMCPFDAKAVKLLLLLQTQILFERPIVKLSIRTVINRTKYWTKTRSDFTSFVFHSQSFTESFSKTERKGEIQEGHVGNVWCWVHYILKMKTTLVTVGENDGWLKMRGFNASTGDTLYLCLWPFHDSNLKVKRKQKKQLEKE